MSGAKISPNERINLLAADVSRRFDEVQDQLDRRFDFELRHLSERLEDTRKIAADSVASLRLLSDDRYASVQSTLSTAFTAEREAVASALSAAEKAVDKAENATEKRFEGVNEFRQQLADQTRSFPTRNEVDSQVQRVSDDNNRLTERLAAMELRLTSRLDLGEGADTGSASFAANRRMAMNSFFAGLAVLVSIITVITLVFLH